MDNFLSNNLDNIKSETDLFGTKVDKLSMKDRIGFLPISIWEPDWNIVKKLKEVVGDNAKLRGDSSYGFQKNQSIFNPHLAQMILSAYCPPNAKIYDSFAGGGTRGFIATAMGHNYYGREIRQEEIDRIVMQQEYLNKHFIIVKKDAQEEPPIKGYFDFSYTCPPYYNLEIYSQLHNDLSNAKTYQDFLGMIKKCLYSNYLSLKKDALSVWIVGNFRDKDSNLIHFNGDIVRLGLEVGFKLHDELIFWGASKCAAQRCGQFVANRRSVRVHEYIIVFIKH